MKLFEATWRDGYTPMERYFDTTLNKSVTKIVDLPSEWFEENSTGAYTSILDDSIKLVKKQGNSKNARGAYGSLDPMYRNIRDNYWGDGNYNITPRTWFLDIETRSGRSFKNEPFGDITIRFNGVEEIISVKTLQNRFYDGSTLNYEFLNLNKWEKLSSCNFLERNTGFPIPEKANEEITLFQLYDSTLDTMIVFGTREWVHENEYSFNFPFKYVQCKNEVEMLKSYFKLFKTLDPLIIYAWNGSNFDFPYIYNRAIKLGLDKNIMSNHGSTKLTTGEYQGRTEFKFKADGHFYIDMLDVYKKFTLSPRPNYQLNTIAEIELKESKVNHSEYAAFDDFYTGKYVIPENPSETQLNSKIYKAAIAGEDELVKELAHSEFVYYGIIDTYLIYRLNEKNNFTSLQCEIAKKMGVTVGDAMGTVKPWSQFIANTSMLNNRVMPPRKEFDQPNVIGGYVKEPIAGKHNWVISSDVNSMYPLLGMVASNMSPETLMHKSKLPAKLRDVVLALFNDQDEEKRLALPKETWSVVSELLSESNLSLSVSGAVFSQKKVGMIPEMVLSIYKDRKIAKKTQFKYEVRKLLIGEIIKEKLNA